MKQGIKIIGGVLLAAALSSPAWAKKPVGPPESQSGGLPGLEDRVDGQQLQIDDLLGQNNFAVVTSDCTLGSHSTSVVSTTDIATGECEVTFTKDVAGCSAVATLVNAFGEITVLNATKTITGDSYEVFTDVPAGTPADESFNLTVTCP